MSETVSKAEWAGEDEKAETVTEAESEAKRVNPESVINVYVMHAFECWSL